MIVTVDCDDLPQARFQCRNSNPFFPGIKPRPISSRNSKERRSSNSPSSPRRSTPPTAARQAPQAHSWSHRAEQVYSLVGAPAQDGPQAPAPASKVTIVAEEPAAFLQSLKEPIDLLYLNGWPIGTEGYQKRHLAVYEAARPHFHERTIILVADTARDHGGKAGLVLPKALDDGFQVLLWGRLTLLGRVAAEARGLVPRVGPPVPDEASLDDAIRMHQEGLGWEAEQLYRGILKQWPDHVVALHLLGVVRFQRADFETALRLIGRAIALDSGRSAFFNNYGAALQGLGRYVEAMVFFHRALQLQPDYVDALSNLGLAQASLGQEEAAIASLRRALELQPRHLDSVKRLAEILQRQGHDEQAVELYRKSIADKPHPALCLNLGNLLSMSGRTDLAVPEYEKAVESQPDLAEAWFNQGVAYQDQRIIPRARECFDRAVELRPERAFWRLRRSTVGPLIFRNNAEVESYREELSRTLESWLAAPRPRVDWNELLFADALPVFNLAYHGRNNRVMKEKIAALFAPYFAQVPPPTGSSLAGRRRLGVVVTQRHEGIFLRCMKVWGKGHRDAECGSAGPDRGDAGDRPTARR